MKAVAALLLLISGPALAQPLAVRTGETWIFTVKGGQPANSRKVASSSKPARGQLMVSVRAMLGTSMTVINNSAIPYTFRAELWKAGKSINVRPCTLPPGNRPIFEHWQEQADFLRIGNFKAAEEEGRC